MLEGIAAKLAANALLGGIGRGAKRGAGALGSWLGRRTPLEIIGFIAMALLVWQHFSGLHVKHALADCQSSSAQLAQQLKASHANEALLRGQLVDQNKRVNALAATSAAQQASFEKGQQSAQERADAALAVSKRLAEAARHAPPPAAPCARPEPLKESWP